MTALDIITAKRAEWAKQLADGERQLDQLRADVFALQGALQAADELIAALKDDTNENKNVG